MTVEKRLEELRSRKMCFNCMKGGHTSRFCDQQRARCGSCGKPHHTLLHMEGWSPAGRRAQGGGNEGNDDTNQVNGSREGNGGVAPLTPLAQPVTEESVGGEEVREEGKEGSD